MLCELCGQPAASLRRVKMSGIGVGACPACVKSGDLEAVPKSGNEPKGLLDAPPLKENCGEVVRKAREARNWSVAQLAAEAKMKEGLLKKIERNEIPPEEPVRRVLERILKISLLEEDA